MFEHVTALTTFICLAECCIRHAERDLSKAHQHVHLCSIIMMPVQVTIQLIVLISHCAGGKSGDCNNLDLSDDKEVSHYMHSEVGPAVVRRNKCYRERLLKMLCETTNSRDFVLDILAVVIAKVGISLSVAVTAVSTHALFRAL
jgi:hypothetical protein